MQAPPPVIADLRVEPFWRTLSPGLWAMAAASAGLWVAQWGGLMVTEIAWVWALILAVCVGIFVWCRGFTPPVRLAWTGLEWQLLVQPTAVPAAGQSSADPAAKGPLVSAHPSLGHLSAVESWSPCSPRVMIDLGPWMLLRLDGPHGRRLHSWVAVSEEQLGEVWRGLRVALYCAPPDLPPTKLH